MKEIKNKTELKLTQEINTLIKSIKKEIPGTFNVEKNNFYIDKKTDFKKIKNSLSNILQNLGINNYKIDELSFLYSQVIIISINENKNEEYIKIFYKSDIFKEIKNYIINVLKLG